MRNVGHGERSKFIQLAKLGSWLAIAGVLQGCSDRGPEMYSVSGVATRNGKPLPGLQIMFRPDDKTKFTDSAAMTDPEGRFTMRVGSREGVFPGPHTVMVADPSALQTGTIRNDPDLRAAIEKYGPSSQLRVTIEEDNDNFELKLD